MRLVISRNGYPRKEDNFNVVFSGPWCVANDIDGVAVSKGAVILSHPWKNKDNLCSDYNKIKIIYEQALQKLVTSLNSIHGIDLSERGWEIFIGPWLRIFINCLFERTMILEEAIKKYNIDEIVVGRVKNPNNISMNTSQFIKDQSLPDWNDQISVEILNTILPNVQIKAAFSGTPPKKDVLNSAVKTKKLKDKVKSTLKYTLCYLDALLMKKRKVVLHRLGYSFFKEVKYMLLTKIVPHYFFPSLQFENKDHNLKLNRSQIKISIGDEKFEQLVSQLIPKYLPKIFFENFNNALSCVYKNYPTSPKHIVTGVAYYVDDVFKLFTAIQTDKGAIYTILQHGGNFGVNVVNDEEELILKTADEFLTWGWTLPKEHVFFKKTKPFGSVLLKHYKKVSSNPNGFIILPVSEWTLTIFRLYNSPQSFRQLDYIDNIAKLFDMLPDNISRIIKLRIQPGDQGWNIRERFCEHGMAGSILQNNDSFVNELSRSRFSIIIDNNSTTILESLALNFPTVAILHKEYWPRDAASKEYDKLVSAGILYTNMQDAVHHIINISDATQSWWDSLEVQEARLEFVSKYAKNAGNLSKIFS